MPSITDLQNQVATAANALMSDDRVRALYAAIWNLRANGIIKKKAKNMTLSEAEGFLNGTCTFEDVAASRGVEPFILATAWSYEHYKLTGFVAIPVDETKAAREARISKQASGKLN